jgi:hypothetical protein
MLFDETETPLTQKQLLEVKAVAALRFQILRGRTMWAAVAFGLSCLAAYQFVDGHHLSPGEETVKQFVLLVWLGLLIVLLYSSMLLWGAFRLLRDPDTNLT